MFGTEEYLKFLEKNINNTLKKIVIHDTDIKNVKLYLTAKDKEVFLNKIKEKYPEIEIEEMESSCLGGCKCFNKESKIYVDNTLKLAIDEQVENRRW